MSSSAAGRHRSNTSSRARMSLSGMTHSPVTALPRFCPYRPGSCALPGRDMGLSAYADPPASKVAFHWSSQREHRRRTNRATEATVTATSINHGPVPFIAAAAAVVAVGAGSLVLSVSHDAGGPGPQAPISTVHHQQDVPTTTGGGRTLLGQ